MRDVNRAGCFLRLGVVDLEMKRYSIFILKGRGERRGWFSMAEMLRNMRVVTGRKESKQEGMAPVKPILERSYAEVVKMSRSRGRNLVRVEVKGEEISKNLSKLEHCLVGCWNPSSARGEDLEKLRILMAKIWGLKGKLGLARMEKGRCCWTLNLWSKLNESSFLRRDCLEGFNCAWRDGALRLGVWMKVRKEVRLG